MGTRPTKGDLQKVVVPTSMQAFDDLVNKVFDRYKRYGLVDKEHCAGIISVTIRHLPNDQAFTTLDHLGHTVIKNIANYVCEQKGTRIQHEVQIRVRKDKLRENPNDGQARDELVKAANEGSTFAKAALEELGVEYVKDDTKLTLVTTAAESAQRELPDEPRPEIQ